MQTPHLVRRGLTAAALLALTAPTSAQVASALLVEDGDLPGAPGVTIDALNNTAVNHAGGYAISISASDDLSRVWGSADGGPGAILRAESTVGDYEQTSFESFYGLSNAGQVAYSATCTDLVNQETGLDTVWLDDTPVAVEGLPVPDQPGFFFSFASRPGVTADGVPYFVGGMTDVPLGSTQFRGLWKGNTPAAELIAGQIIPNLPEPISGTGSSIDFDYRFSASGNRLLAPVNIGGVSTSEDGTLILDGAGLLIDGSLVREGSPVPAAAGGLPGENWDNFDFVGVTDLGAWFFTGDTDGDTGSDEFVCVDGVIVHREGDVLDGFELSGSIEGAYMNADGDLAFIWDVNDPVLGNVEALYCGSQLLLKEGDAVDLDGDGLVDPGAVISSFTGISSLTLGDRDANAVVNVYFTADIDTAGTSSSSDDVEGFFCLAVEAPECFLVMGPGLGQSSVKPGNHWFVSDLSEITASWAVSFDDVATVVIPASLPVTAVAGAQLPGGGLGPVQELLLDEFVVQVLMWNPYVFPGQPEQWSEPLHVQVTTAGRVRVTPLGDGAGMGLSAEVSKGPDGETLLSFPFSIDGF